MELYSPSPSHSFDPLQTLILKLESVKEELLSWHQPVQGPIGVKLIQLGRDFLETVLRMTSASEVKISEIHIETSDITAVETEDKDPDTKFSIALDLYEQILCSSCVVKINTGDDSEFIAKEEEEAASDNIDQVPSDIKGEALLEEGEVVLDQFEVMPVDKVEETPAEEETIVGTVEVKDQAAESFIVGHTKGGIMQRRCPECGRDIPVTHWGRHPNFCSKETQPQKLGVEKAAKETKSKYDCPKCGRSFVFEKNLTAHREQAHHERRTLKCSECKSRHFFTVADRVNHMMQYHGRRLHCDLCDFKTHLIPEFRQHLIKEHSINDQDIWHNIESRISSAQETFRRTVKKPCEKCGKSFSIPSLKKHLQQCTGKVKVPKAKQTYLCPDCGKSIRFYTGLQNHLKFVHKRDFSFKCLQCSQAYLHEIDRDQHMYSAHGININNRMVYSCSNCSFKALRKFNLTRHLKTCGKKEDAVKDDQGSFMCTLCGRQFKKLSGLRTHQLQHKSLRQHTCQICSYQTTQWKMFQQHMEMEHKDWKSRVCPGNCGFRTNLQGSLSKHTKNCRKFAQFFASVYNQEEGNYQCTQPSCSFKCFNKQVFFRHFYSCLNSPSQKEDTGAL